MLRFRDLSASCFGLRFRVLRFRNYSPSSKSAVEPRSKRHQSSVEEEEEDELGSAGNFELIFFSRQRSRHKLSCYFFITYSFPTLLFSVVHIKLVYFTNRKE